MGTVQNCQLRKMAGSKTLRSLSLFLLLALISYFSESAFTGTLTSAGLTFTLPTLSTLTQTQLIYLTAGGLSLGAAAGLAGLAVASSLLADSGSSGGTGGYGAPAASSYGAPESSYGAPESSYGAPESSYGAPESSYGAPESSYGAPESSYEAPASSYSAPASSYSAPASSYSAPASSYAAPEPSYSSPSSGYEAPSSGGDSHGHGYLRKSESEVKTAAPKFHYQWQQNIANLGRRKRATTDEEGVNSFLESISSVDKSDCGKLYLCEISATPPSKLLREDQKTLELLRRTYSQRLETPGRKQFDLAWQIGSKSGSVDVCRKQFRKCTIRGIVSLVKYGTVTVDTL